MKQIELEFWERDPDKEYALKNAGYPKAQDVFEVLEKYLKGIDRLPDEYFSLNYNWENNRLIPKGAEVEINTNYGGSEGIYTNFN